MSVNYLKAEVLPEGWQILSVAECQEINKKADAWLEARGLKTQAWGNYKTANKNRNAKVNKKLVKKQNKL